MRRWCVAGGQGSGRPGTRRWICARGKARRKKKKKKTRELEQKQRAGRSSRDQVERRREREAQRLLSRTNSIASTKRQKDSFEGPVETLSLSSSSLSSFSSPPPFPRPCRLYPLPSLPLSLSLFHSCLTLGPYGVYKRRGNAAGMPGQPTACIPVYNLLYLGPGSNRGVHEACVAAAASYRADKDGLKLAPCQSTESTDSASLSLSLSPDPRRLRAVSSHGRTLPVRVCPFLSSCPFVRKYIGARVSAAEPVSRE